MDVVGRLEISVDGERWRPVTSLVGRGPDEACYVVRFDEDGAATVVFGDGAAGRRPAAGARIAARYRAGSGATGHAANDRPKDFGVELLELLAYMNDVLSRHQDEIASEAYLETATGRRSLRDAADLQQAIAGLRDNEQICFCLRPVIRRERSQPI